MKKTLLALMAMLALASCSKKEENAPAGTNVHITGNIKGFKKGRLFLTRIQDTTAVIIDTINIDGSSAFETHVKLDSPEMLYLVIDRVSSNSVDDNLPVFAEPGNIKIETTLDGFFANAKITGSENQKLYEEYLVQKKRIKDASLDLIEKELMAKKKKNVVQLDSIEQAKKRNEVKLYFTTTNFAVNHGKFDIAPYLALNEIPDINLKYLYMIQEKLSPAVKKSHYGQQFEKLIEFRKKNDPILAAQSAAEAK